MKTKHNLFISFEEWKLQESIKEKMSTPYKWKITKPKDVNIVILKIDGKTGKIIK